MNPIHDAAQIRRADAPLLAAALDDTRAQSLALFAAMSTALGHQLHIRYGEELNPPLWELGHVGWFEEFWIARNTERLRGVAARVESPRAACPLKDADGLYNSSIVEHTRRWHLDLPDARRTVDYLAQVRRKTLVLLQDTPDDDQALYFFRMVLLHEDMHREAALMMAQVLGLAVPHRHPAPASAPRHDLHIEGASLTVGAPAAGFAFDNELGAHETQVDGFAIDSAPVTWGGYLAFIDAGGYDQRTHWSDEAWAWQKKHLPRGLPRYLTRAEDGTLQQARFGQWHALDPDAPAVHISLHEAQAWCGWAGRRLPSEHEWTLAAAHAAFEWGQVWEWTASPFAPFPGFTPHPYRDYSEPWFDGRPVLKGGSCATSSRMKHLAYRNYFTAGRNDVFAGFRTCAV
jgi:gamma-glutamyl hercynylcysteine S-oxide synthase